MSREGQVRAKMRALMDADPTLSRIAARLKAEEALPPQMSGVEAEAEAVRRWGDRGYAKRVEHAKKHERMEVGLASPGGIWGRGATYEEAFADAERRGGRRS